VIEVVIEVEDWGERGRGQGGVVSRARLSRMRERGRGQGGVVSRARLSRVCPARLREEGERCQLSCKLRELLIPSRGSHHGHAG